MNSIIAFTHEVNSLPLMKALLMAADKSDGISYSTLGHLRTAKSATSLERNIVALSSKGISHWLISGRFSKEFLGTIAQMCSEFLVVTNEPCKSASSSWKRFQLKSASLGTQLRLLIPELPLPRQVQEGMLRKLEIPSEDVNQYLRHLQSFRSGTSAASQRHYVPAAVGCTLAIN